MKGERMMKKTKLFLIYGIIGLLLLATLVGVVIDRISKAQPINSELISSTPSNNLDETVVGIGLGEDYAETTRLAIENAGGLKDIINEGDTVLIKPNICTYAEAGSPLITDYRVVQKIADMARELGAERIIVAEGPITGLAFTERSKNNGYGLLKDVELMEFNSLGREDCYEVTAENSMTNRAFYIPKIYMDADVVIGVPKLKTHFQPDAVVSLCLKNLYGVPSGKLYGLGYKNALHAMGLKESVVDLNKIRKPDFNVIEGIIGGEGDGPLNNTPVQSNIILAGRDPVALDTVASTIMGFDPEDIPIIKLAAEQKLGISDLDKIQVVGAKPDEIQMNFRRFE